MDSRLLMTLQVAVVGVQKIGAVPHGTRVTAPIASGHFEGRGCAERCWPVAVTGRFSGGDGVLELDCASHSRPTTAPHPHDLVRFRHGPPK